MNYSEGAFSVLRQSSDPACAAAIEQAVSEALRSRPLPRSIRLISRPSTASTRSASIAAFLHAARLGIFELSWNVLCPGCGGVLEAGTTLKTINRDEYDCGLCAAGYEPTLDEMVEVTFTVSPRVRRIAAHSPDTLPDVEYYRQIFWSSGVDLPETLGDSLAEITSTRSSCRRREGGAVAAAAQAVRHRLRPGDARHAVHRRQGRADPRAADAVDGLQQGQGADRHHRACGPARCG